jgi:hypothetical protein
MAVFVTELARGARREKQILGQSGSGLHGRGGGSGRGAEEADCTVGAEEAWGRRGHKGSLH